MVNFGNGKVNSFKEFEFDKVIPERCTKKNLVEQYLVHLVGWVIHNAVFQFLFSFFGQSGIFASCSDAFYLCQILFLSFVWRSGDQRKLNGLGGKDLIKMENWVWHQPSVVAVITCHAQIAYYPSCGIRGLLFGGLVRPH